MYNPGEADALHSTVYETHDNIIKRNNSFFHSSRLSLSHRGKKGGKGRGDQDIKYFETFFADVLK